MKQAIFYSTNNKSERANFETALLNGMASNYGLYMIDRKDIPKLSNNNIKDMRKMSYSEIAFNVLNPFLGSEIPKNKLEKILDSAYREDKIPTKVQHVKGKTHIMWLTQGPTYSFKDYAARFFGRTLDYFLEKKGLKKTVMVATSGDTGGAIADALYGLDNIDNIVFFPKGLISKEQRRQMTIAHDNIYAFEVNGDFDVCQALAKYLLKDKRFAKKVFEDENMFTSANSISVGRLLPQAVYPFFAYSRIDNKGKPMITSIPSGNFGDMMGTRIAKEMGLPISTILCGVNENTEFPEFLETGKYVIKPTKISPSSAMNVSHPSNFARLVDFYGGHIFDKRDIKTGKVIKSGIIDKMPDLAAIRKDIDSIGVNNLQHSYTIKEVYDEHKIILDPHGAVGWASLDAFLNLKHDKLAVIYETADPGKFPNIIKDSIGITPELPPRMKLQEKLEERIYSIESKPEQTKEGLKLSDNQIKEAKSKIIDIYNK